MWVKVKIDAVDLVRGSNQRLLKRQLEHSAQGPTFGRVSAKFELDGVFRRAEKPREQFRIGTEVEKTGVATQGGQPTSIHYEGSAGVREVLLRLERFGWRPESEYPGGPVLQLMRDSASITLEPGAQLELSGAPLATLSETHDELLLHRREIDEIGAELGITWLGLGFHPYARREDLRFVPKLRYGVMQEYLPTKGTRGLDMMLRTCTVQANLDYHNEQDAMHKLWLSLRLQPIATALFANSPFYEGKRSDRISERADVWLHVDPPRSGLVPAVWEKQPHELRYTDYIEWALSAPMFLIKRNDQVVHNTGQSFRDFLQNGFGEHRASEYDWETHLNTLFPEARLKRTLEMRGADAHDVDGCVALAAFWKGLLYSDSALSKATELCAGWDLAAMERTRQEIPTRALDTGLEGTPLLTIAEKLVAIANDGLAEAEQIFLAPLKACVSAGQSLGMWRLAQTSGSPLAMTY